MPLHVNVMGYKEPEEGGALEQNLCIFIAKMFMCASCAPFQAQKMRPIRPDYTEAAFCSCKAYLPSSSLYEMKCPKMP